MNQYYLCPRCQFRVLASKKVCGTCGFDVSTLRTNSESEQSAAPRSKFSLPKVFGFGKQKESTNEKPVLG